MSADVAAVTALLVLFTSVVALTIRGMLAWSQLVSSMAQISREFKDHVAKGTETQGRWNKETMARIRQGERRLAAIESVLRAMNKAGDNGRAA